MKNLLLIYCLFFGLAHAHSQTNTDTPNPLTTTAIAEMSQEQLRTLLDSIHVEDQQYRKQMGTIRKEYGSGSKEMQELIGKMRQADISNTKIVTKILDTHGWLSTEEVGRTANSALFLVIQHADLDIQEKYLPMMRQAVERGKARASSLALLEDRIALRNGQAQIYGSQIGSTRETGKNYVLPMIDPDRLDERRASVGLAPMQEYLFMFSMKWDLEAYKKQLPELLKTLKQK